MGFAELCEKYDCDKESTHRYGDAYDILLRGLVDSPSTKILEIGIYKGAGLRVLKELLPNAIIYAIDIDPDAVRLAPEGVTAIRGNQNDPNFLTNLGNCAGPFNLIIDDGSHLIRHQKQSFETLWPFVTVGGLYVIEDLESSLLRASKYNPSGEENTLNMLLQMVRSHIHAHKWNGKPPMLSFYREMSCITKME